MAGRRFTDSKEAEIAKVYVGERMSGTDLAEMYQVSPTTIYSVLCRQGIDARTLSEIRRRFSLAEEIEIAKMYTSGRISGSRIARAYRVSCCAVYNALRRQGIEIKYLRKLTDGEEAEISKIYTHGMKSARQIARAYGLQPHHTYSTLERRGTKLRSKAEAHLLHYPNKVVRSGNYPIISLSRLGQRGYEIACPMVPDDSVITVHRLVMAMHLRRPLCPDEIVHHRDGNKKDYRLRSLELLTSTKLHSRGFGNPFYQRWQEALSENRRLRDMLKRRNYGIQI